MNEIDKAYLAGVIDSDGTVTISMSISKAKNPSILFIPQIRFGWKDIYQQHVFDIHEKLGVGKVYFSNKGKPEGMCFLQTTNLKDAIFTAEQILPYLTVKQDRTKRFLEAAKYWNISKTRIGGKREGRLRTKEEIQMMVKTSLGLNADRQTVRYREKKGWDYWKQKIEELYT